MNEIFKVVAWNVEDLLSGVLKGGIGLPDLQRPFVWKDKKVRDLLDSMMKGYPIGFVMLWHSPEEFEHTKQIGVNEKNTKAPMFLVIDGQQRLTALLGAIKGVKIVDSSYKKRNIKISYNPLNREFAVWTRAYERSPEWISIISDVFSAERDHKIPSLRGAYIKQLNESRQKAQQAKLSEEEEIMIEYNINALLNLCRSSISSLEIKATASEEDVADIFVRVNSGGQKLTEKDFIETLLAVYDNDEHKRISKFCEESRIPVQGSSFNHILEVNPVHLIRVAVGLAFDRARLKYAYMLLRGKDLKTEKIDEETRNKNLTAFREAMNVVTSLKDWHDFMNIVADAGYLNSTMISSDNAVIFTYMFYLLGKNKYKVPVNDLRTLMRRFFFVSTITAFFTGSPESDVERVLADLRGANADKFIEIFNNLITNSFTEDYFNHNLINDLETSGTNSPVWRGYLASMIVLDHPMFFSYTSLSHFFVVGTSGKQSSIDVHHIFPKNYLAEIGISNDRQRNQIANLVCINKAENISISDKAPKKYISEWRETHGEDAYLKVCKENALPLNFEDMDYTTFLVERRKLMAQLIKDAYLKLSKSGQNHFLN